MNRYCYSLFLVLACLLAACGQKGPLYLPDDPPEQAEPAEDEAREEQPSDEEENGE